MFLLLLACTGDPAEGTVVGNPGDGYTQMAPTAADVEIVELGLFGGQLWLEDCSGDGQQELAPIEPTDPMVAPVVLPAGRWCRLGLDLTPGDPGLWVLGTRVDGTAQFELLLQVEWVELQARRSGGVLIDGQSFVLELGEPGWLSADLLGLPDESGMITVDIDHPLHDPLVDTITLRSAMFEDSDRDGLISESEREVGPVAAGEGREEDVVDTAAEGSSEPDVPAGCGGRGGAAAVLLPLLGLKRRRRCA